MQDDCFAACPVDDETPGNVCPLADHNSCSEALEGEIACGGSLSGCLNETDDKYYKIGGSEGKDVTVTVTHYGDNCNKNDVYLYSGSCGELNSSKGMKTTDECFVEEPAQDVIVGIIGDANQDNENCRWELDVECEDVCPESGSELIGPFNIDCDQFISPTKNCGMKVGGKDHISGCIYSDDSKFYRVVAYEGENIEVKLTNIGDSCRNNALIIYDYSDDEIASLEGSDSVKTWVDMPPNDPWTFGLTDIGVEVRSHSSDKNCLWELDVAEVGDCESLCVDQDDKSCGPYKCSDGFCTEICDERCGAECEDNDDCGQGEYCNAECECIQGLTTDIEVKRGKSGWNILSFPFKEATFTTDCTDYSKIIRYHDPATDIAKAVEITSIEKIPDEVSDYYKKGWWFKTNEDCTITLNGKWEDRLLISDLPKLKRGKSGWNIMSVPYDGLNILTEDGDCNVISGPFRHNSLEDKLILEQELEPSHGYWIRVEEDCELA
jgi:hypothetical protein